MNDEGPLQGVRVLELGSFIAGPFAGQLLADLGADVIKVEAPGAGDAMRRWGRTVDGRSVWWSALSRNKRLVAVDLRRPEGQDVVRRLAVSCDAVLENFTPGRLDEWGLGYERLSADNPRLVMTRVSGFGQTGPRTAEPGFGAIAEAMGGLRELMGWPDLGFDQLDTALTAAGIPHGLIYRAPDILDDPQYAARGMIQRVHDAVLGRDVPMAGIVPRLTRTPGAIRWTGADVAPHTHQVLGELGYHDDERQALVDTGVIPPG